MDLMTGLPIWAQAQAGTANPNAIALLALRRWCGSLTLSSPRSAPGLHGFWALLAGLALLFLVVLVAQGPLRAFRQLLDIPGHIRLVRDGTRRFRRAGRMVAALIGFTVLSWTGAQSLAFLRDGGRDQIGWGTCPVDPVARPGRAGGGAGHAGGDHAAARRGGAGR